MGRQIRPAKVYQNAVASLGSQMIAGKQRVAPAWLKAVEKIPPSEILTRPYPVQHAGRKPKGIFRPTRIRYPEDILRSEFYRDHPWELARPRMLLERDGTDSHHWDWSKGVLQRGIPLCGECVVQRQLWLMENEGLGKAEAYDKARREFYALRQQEEIERRITQEEAKMVGGYFGMSMLRVGMKIEDQTYEKWKAWAAKEIATMQAARQAAYTSFGEENKTAPEQLEEEEAAQGF